MKEEFQNHQIPLEGVIIFVMNTNDFDEEQTQKPGDEYWMEIPFLHILHHMLKNRLPFGPSPVQIFCNHLYHG